MKTRRIEECEDGKSKGQRSRKKAGKERGRVRKASEVDKALMDHKRLKVQGSSDPHPQPGEAWLS